VIVPGRWLASAILRLAAAPALAQNCPAPLAQARRLVLVTSETMNAAEATLRLYERAAPGNPWRALGRPEPAVIGKSGMAWSHFFRRLARRGEPIKVDRDKRAPAGVYSIGRSFGTLASSRPGHLRVTGDTVCVDDPSSPAYNTITSRRRVGPRVHAENMSRALPMYRRGLLVDYPTDARARAGSCIFIHVWRSPTTGTAGCVAIPEARVVALQEFAAGGAALAILPRRALDRLPGCLPGAAANGR
jgi:L,D-peptidoglycan transpeptidase YkuD (ErfK/YbiS/YcfS/YnhG family)